VSFNQKSNYDRLWELRQPPPNLATQLEASTARPRRPLELLDGQQPQGVAHGHRHAILAQLRFWSRRRPIVTLVGVMDKAFYYEVVFRSEACPRGANRRRRDGSGVALTHKELDLQHAGTVAQPFRANAHAVE
jgi:hypothetical protein